ncbi:16S rRNA (uracil(1498)-N(3))-methyltransferase [Nitrosomonas sp. Nm166]|uniref:16S rRNA (uracil(1498)-N(3))-methyltransferase n=1 Tax=Nitrosomonas sp. Nm166 TaxID=1881054 RepID=UPI0008ED2062|nr:16S rRNA (uracil(1498)-N(3))-methyltransferase [Nitrosomonas sp. Nm166]SFE94431.1 16S rRNA (uracil1498-N3)-methyltransferase [Nitrosomonas sp. Nm166]
MHTRFYHPAEITVGQLTELSVENKHHAARVLRLRRGDSITLFNGNGGEFSAHIDNISKSSTTVLIDHYHDTDCESPLHIELAQAICVNEKMDWIIQKAVELGVTCIQPLSTARSIVHLSGERSTKRLQHWQKIVISACEQCGRNHLPQVFPLISLPEWLSQKKTSKSLHDLHLMLSTTATESLRNIPKPPVNAHVALVIGPEGGFTQEEETAILHVGFIPLRLGKRILRTESAALAAIAALQTLWGDY